MATVSKVNQNQFAQTSALGAVDLAFSFNTKSAVINPNSVSTNPIQAGTVVKLIPGAVPGLIVDVAAAGDKPYGVIVLSLKKNTYVAGDAVEIACKGDVIHLETSAAVNRNDLVQNDPTGPTIATKTTGATLGRALGQVSGTGMLIRVEIDPDAT
jgi:hypothetical protein